MSRKILLITFYPDVWRSNYSKYIECETQTQIKIKFIECIEQNIFYDIKNNTYYSYVIYSFV